MAATSGCSHNSQIYIGDVGAVCTLIHPPALEKTVATFLFLRNKKNP